MIPVTSTWLTCMVSYATPWLMNLILIDDDELTSLARTQLGTPVSGTPASDDA
jgi:hypothetical protein